MNRSRLEDLHLFRTGCGSMPGFRDLDFRQDIGMFFIGNTEITGYPVTQVN